MILEEWASKLKKALNRSIQFLTESYLVDGTAVYSLYHEGLREYFHIKEDLAKDLQKVLKVHGQGLFDWKRLQGFTRLYSLNYGAPHLYQLRDTDRSVAVAPG